MLHKIPTDINLHNAHGRPMLLSGANQPIGYYGNSQVRGAEEHALDEQEEKEKNVAVGDKKQWKAELGTRIK